MKQIRNNKIKIQLHINDNTKITTKDYRELLYSEVRNDKQPLSTFNTNNIPTATSQQFKPKPEEPKKKDINKEKSRTKTIVNDHHEDNKCYNFESSQSREETRYIRKDIKSSMERSIKSRPDSRKKGISLCSKSMSKNTSLKKKKQDTQGTETHEVKKGELIKRLKAGQRLGTEKS